MKRVLLTSFRDAKNHDCFKYSIARWQPKGYTFPVLDHLAPLYPSGRAITMLEPEPYRYKYEASVLSKEAAQEQLCDIIRAMNENDTIALLCWCNPSRQGEHNKLMCHRILVGFWIEKNIPDVEVVYLDGAENTVWSRTQ